MSTFKKANILVPEKDIDYSKWSVVACDQFTSSPAYWAKCEAIIGDAPSAYNYILPEAYLETEKEQTHGAKMDGVGALLLGRHFDGTGTGDLDIRGAFAGINEGIAFVEAVTPADAGDGVVTPGGGVGDQSIPLGFDVGILVGVLLQHGTVTEVQLHVAAQDQVAAKEGLACGEGDGAAACGMHRVDGSLNGGPVIGGAVACRAVVGDHIYGCSCGFCSNGDQQQTQTQAQNRDDGKFLHNFCFLSDNVDLQPIIVLYKL